MNERQPSYWRLAQLWPKIPDAVQDALTELAEAMVEELAKAESPATANTPK